ncbi:MAG TPA: ribosome maturation factor RimM [Ktedonobacteraceae bacterium]|nr:ribosome maturation factor RimM [Ktedonobacteraceae bacterium]
MPAKQEETEWVTIGQIVAFLGLRGELKVRLLTDIPNRFEQLGVIYLGPEHQPYSIERVRPYKGEMVVLKLKGIESANAAEPLRSLDLLIPVSQLATLPSDSYYRHDILGLTVLTLDGRKLGQIIDIIETGSNDVYMVKSPDGKQVPIPAIKDVVKQVDIVKRTMYIDPIPGLLEMPAAEEQEAETGEHELDEQVEEDF